MTDRAGTRPPGAVSGPAPEPPGSHGHRRVAAAALVVLAVSACPVSAHRLDEYLQATRVSLAADAIGVELDLTPGAAVAAGTFARVDADRDGLLSDAECRSYARRVVAATRLEVDRRVALLALVTARCPTLEEMQLGTGTIVLTARAEVRAGTAGDHELRFVNAHRPDASAYLVNALTPPAGFEITSQRRDPVQRELTLEYRVAPAIPAWPFVGGAAALVLLAFGRRRRASGLARPSWPRWNGCLRWLARRRETPWPSPR